MDCPVSEFSMQKSESPTNYTKKKGRLSLSTSSIESYSDKPVPGRHIVLTSNTTQVSTCCKNFEHAKWHVSAVGFSRPFLPARFSGRIPDLAKDVEYPRRTFLSFLYFLQVCLSTTRHYYYLTLICSLMVSHYELVALLSDILISAT